MAATDFYIIKDNCVYLQATEWFAERLIGELKEANQQYTIASMEERFAELIDKVQEIKKEFESSADIIKLAGKVSRTKNYLCNAKAIGDYSELFKQLDVMEASIKVAVDENLAKKDAICLAAEALLTSKDWKQATEQLRELQKEYKELPVVPDLQNESLRERFEKAKDTFFKQKQANFESFEQDLLDNLAKKIELCEQAESWQQSTDWKKTTEAYQALNEAWKQIGIVPKHRMDEIWLRFNTAKDVFFARKKEHFGEIKVEQEENLTKKLALIEKANELKESKDWKKTTDEFTALMDAWKKIGRAPQEKNDEVWEQFLSIKNYFFQQKDAHYTNIRFQLEDNYAKKLAIVQRAEELKNTHDFEGATHEFNELFEEWKKIGRIPKEHGDGPWEQFLEARRVFFRRKDADRDQRKRELHKDLNEKIQRNKSAYNRLRRDIEREEDLLAEMNERINNLPATLRSYEKREEYKEVIEEIKAKVSSLHTKAKELKDKLFHDEKEMNFLIHGPRKKQHNEQDATDQSNITEQPNSATAI